MKKRRVKALSVQQPWANLIASGEKTIEVRKRPTKHRGPLLICASKRLPVPPFGCMVALVDVVDCWPLKQANERAAQVKRERGDKRFAWVLENARRVPNHPVTGNVGFYNCELPPDVAKLL